MRIGFAGTPEPALIVLKKLIDSGSEISAVITKPDRPKKRSIEPIASPVAALAESLSIPVLKPTNLADQSFTDKLSKLNLDLVIVVAYGKLIPKFVLSIPRFGWFNLHFSLLPKYRGAAPLQHAILNGEKTTGVTLFKLDEGLDTGLVLDAAEISIVERSAFEILPEMAEIGAQLVIKNLNRHPESWVLNEQSSHGISSAVKISTAETFIDWNESGEFILRKIRAFSAGPIARCFFNGEIFKIHSGHLTNTLGISAGEICLVDKRVLVGTGDSAIELVLIQPSGKRQMSGRDWWNGLRLEVASFD